jgi:hypothetical protein
VFRVNESFRFEIPPGLDLPGSEASYYQLVEVTIDNPIWLVDVVGRSSSNDSITWRRKFLAHDARIAMDVLRLDNWSSRALFVLAPGRKADEERFRFLRCRRLWECDEPEGGLPSWKVETDVEELLISVFGTSLGEEGEGRLVWEDPLLA